MDDKLQRGFIALSRDLIDSSLWQLPPDHLRVALYLLLKARHKSNNHTLPDGTKIRRGELVTSMLLIAENCSYYENRMIREMSRKKALNILNNLESIGFLERNSHRKGTHITLCNYDTYQTFGNYKLHEGETLGEHRGNTEGTQRATNNNANNANNENNVEDTFPALLAELEKDQSFKNAVAAVYASNGSFAPVPRFAIENSFKAYPDRSKWPEAVRGMAAKFAGVEMSFPNKSLQNWLAGKVETKAGETNFE